MTAATQMTPLRFGYLGEPRLLRGIENGALDLPRHRNVHGGIPDLNLQQLIDMCHAVSLAGRGGAGFSVAIKLASVRRGHRVVVINATESEPASFKDRLLMTLSPHLVLDGAEVVATALRSRDIHIAVHEESIAVGLRHAVAERPRGLRFRVHVIGGGFVAGEARSVVRALSGGEALPPGRRTLPTDKGVDGHPTFLSNAETFAQIASLVQMGVAGYASVGAHDERGTTLLTVNGAVEKPGVYEVPLGTSLGALLHSAGSHPVAGLAVGGYHGAWVTPRTEMPLSRAGLSKQGGVLGAGVVLVIDDSTCALGELARIGSWLSHQSARQCGPCMFGLPALTEDLVAIIRGKANAERPLFRHASMVSGRGACAHPDGAARFLTTGITALARDVDTHRRHGNCGRPLLGQLPIDRR